MQSMSRAVIFALLSSAGSVKVREADTYGPGGCVFVDRSPSGSCVLHTRCDGHDVANFDFSFDCVSQAAQDASPAHNTHSLGVGSFDDTEDFDTGVQCQSCLPPPGAILKKSHKQAVSTVAATKAADSALTQVEKPTKAKSEKASKDKGVKVESLPMAPEGAERFGPSLCVTTWKNESSGTCVVRTNCMVPMLISAYDFGFQCANENGEVSKHTYGQNSFAAQETFDTQVACDKCLALEDQPIDPNEDVPKLANEVDSLKQQMLDLAKTVETLTSKVGLTAASKKKTDEKNLRGSDAKKGGEKKDGKGKKEEKKEKAKAEDTDDDSDEGEDGDDSDDDAPAAPAPAAGPSGDAKDAKPAKAGKAPPNHPNPKVPESTADDDDSDSSDSSGDKKTAKPEEADEDKDEGDN